LTQSEPIELARYRDPDGDAYSGIGAELRDARLHRGAELADVATDLRIRRPHLEAIESGAFDELPGRVYAVGFMRAYSEYLGLDPDLVVDRFRDETTDIAPGTELNFPEAPPQSWRPQLGLFGVASLLSVVVYGGWYYWQSLDTMSLDVVAEVPDEFATIEGVAEPEMVGPNAALPGDSTAEEHVATAAAIADLASAPAEAVVLAPAEDVVMAAAELPAIDTAAAETEITPASEAVNDGREAAEAVEEPGSAQPITGELVETPDAPTLIETPPPPPVAPSGESAARVFGQGNAGARVVLRALADSWVQVQGDNNDLLLSRILNAGDSYLIPNGANVRLTTGNAGGLQILLDGKALPPLGESGAVRRDVPISAEALSASGD
jgi:cytoskeleton protein RodZ